MRTGSSETLTATRGTARRPPRLAVIDRDSGLIQVLAKRLAASGWEHRVLASPVRPEALAHMRLQALVIDVSLLGSGCWDYLEQVCGRLPGLAVVVCTAPSSVAQRVRGLRLGVDAWITKPCHPEELIAVVEATVRKHRRAEAPPLEATATIGEITIRPDLHQAYSGDRSLELTAREYEILQLLVQTDRVLRREEIYELVWGYAMVRGDRSVDVFVRKLRQKLRNASPRWSYIHTHFGVGYRFSAELEAEGAVAEDGAAAEADGAAAQAEDAASDGNGEDVRSPREPAAPTVVG